MLVITTTAPVDFGAQAIASTTMRTITARNSGMTTTSALTLSITGDTDEFALVTGASDTCTGAQLPGGAMCTFEVAFTPAAEETYDATVTVTAAMGGSPMIAVTGAGTDPGN